MERVARIIQVALMESQLFSKGERGQRQQSGAAWALNSAL